MSQLTPSIVSQHGLKPDEYQRILQVLGREPNLTELGIFSAMWSEHCSYKSSKVHLKKLPTQGPRVLQGPGENAGVIDVGDGWAIVFKMESHNHPSFIEPYQGAATGVGGILRDVFTMGARPIANLNSLRFGSVKHPKTKYLVNGVVAGIAGYGNCMGVPTVAGEVFFDACYDQNILVNAMTVGLARKDRIFKGKASGVGNPVLYVGSKTGRDGIHGATMASEEFNEKSEEKRPTVQVGDPFTEKLLLEACLELMQQDYLVGIQDMGAAGLTSSSFEMAARGGTGIEMNLDAIPTREEKMTAYELMLSESQERMLMVVKKGFEEDAKKIFQKWDLDAAVVGTVTNDGFMKIWRHGKLEANLPIEPLVQAAPLYDRPIEIPASFKNQKAIDLHSIPVPQDLEVVVQKMMGSPNLSSRRWVWEQYDHMVMTNTVVLPGSDAAVLRIKGTSKAVAVTSDCNSRYCFLDPKEGAKIAVAEAARNVVCSGAQPVAITNCLNFGNPEKPEVMWQLSQAIDGMREACLALETPVTGGNVSLYNETNGKAIYPTPTIGMVGLIENLNYVTTAFFKREGDLIALVGDTFAELGGSEYLNVIHQRQEGFPPKIDLAREKLIQSFVLNAIQKGYIASAHDLSEGGLAVALAESAISGPQILGAEIEIETELRPDVFLFSESQSRVLLSFNPQHWNALQDLAKTNAVPLVLLGKVDGNHLKINDWMKVELGELKNIWCEGFQKNLNLAT